MADVVIATLEKNLREQLRIELNDVRGRELLSLRVWVERRDGSVVPTRKGISCSVGLLPQIIDALQEALERTQKTPAQG